MTQPVVSPNRILLVEPYDDARDMLSVLLEIVGHEVKAVATGGEALTSAVVQFPDVVLTETAIPDMDCRDLYARLRNLSNMSNLKVIALTGYCTESDAKELLHLGFDCVLLKPSNLEEITRAIT